MKNELNTNYTLKMVKTANFMLNVFFYNKRNGREMKAKMINGSKEISNAPRKDKIL